MDRYVRVVRLACLLLVLLQLHAGCARVMRPEGGPKDAKPPRVVRTTPPMSSYNFTAQKVRIYFDEYVVLKDQQKQIVFSPPLAYPFTALIKGKSVEISFTDTLKQDATYSITFGNAIVDLTEGNPLADYHYVFSTGSQIDTCFLEGTIRDVYLHTPAAGFAVMLYRENVDSLPRTVLPDFVTKSNAEGYFSFAFIPEGAFKIFALADENANYRYDLPKERIAFLDTLVRSTCVRPVADTLDSVIPLPNLRLESFHYEKPRQVLLARTRPAPERIALAFSTPPEGEVRMRLVDYSETELLLERSDNRDTVSFWVMDTLVARRDTLRVILDYFATDSLQLLSPRSDTLLLGYRFAEKKDEKSMSQKGRFGRGERPEAEEKAPRDTLLWMGFTHSNFRSVLPTDTVRLRVAYPPVQSDLSRIELLVLPDSTLDTPQVLPVADKPREFSVIYPWIPSSQYVLRGLPGAFVDIEGRVNYTVEQQITTVKPSDFASIHFVLDSIPTGCLIEIFDLTKERPTRYRVRATHQGDTVTAAYVKPGNYGVRLVYDRNENGQWDTGNYSEGLLPESVRYFQDEKGNSEVKVRQNWEYDIHINYSQLEE